MSHSKPNIRSREPTDLWPCSDDDPAVDEFRKAIEAAEKQAAAQQPAKHP